MWPPMQAPATALAQRSENPTMLRAVQPAAVNTMRGSPTTATTSAEFAFPPAGLSSTLSVAVTAELVATNVAASQTPVRTAVESYQALPTHHPDDIFPGSVSDSREDTRVNSGGRRVVSNKNNGVNGISSAIVGSKQPGECNGGHACLDEARPCAVRVQQQASFSKKENEGSLEGTIRETSRGTEYMPERNAMLNSSISRPADPWSPGGPRECDGGENDYLENEENYGSVGVDGKELYQTIPVWQQVGGGSAPRIARLARTWQRPEEVVVTRDAYTGVMPPHLCIMHAQVY